MQATPTKRLNGVKDGFLWEQWVSQPRLLKNSTSGLDALQHLLAKRSAVFRDGVASRRMDHNGTGKLWWPKKSGGISEPGCWSCAKLCGSELNALFPLLLVFQGELHQFQKGKYVNSFSLRVCHLNSTYRWYLFLNIIWTCLRHQDHHWTVFGRRVRWLELCRKWLKLP